MKKWYQEGLNFSCYQCGHCCTFPGGYVWLDLEEIQVIANQLEMTVTQFGSKYLYKYRGKYSLIEKPNGHCVFYEKGSCKIYKVRPTQCQTFPFWPENCRSQDAWDNMKKTCQGIDRGVLHSQSEIEGELERQERSER
jgi:Fe-S-cluster containining protein